jgi:phosphoglycolate phosphatase
MRNSYNIILFDLDGTLTDPQHGIINSIRYALAKFDMQADDVETLKACIGPPLLASFEKHFNLGERDARKAVEYYREYFSEKGIYENEVFPGIPRLLEELAGRQLRLVCATSKPTLYARRILKHFNLCTFLEFVVGSNMDLTRTDKTEIICDVLEKLKIQGNERAVMVGDRAEDIVGAHNNNIDSIAVTYGYGSETELQNTHPTYHVHSVAELRSLLNAPLLSGKNAQDI